MRGKSWLFLCYFSPHLSLRDIFPTKGKTLKISQMDLQKMQWNCILPKVLLNFFQKIFRVWGETPRSFSSINYNLAFCSINLYLKTAWDFVSGSDCRQSYFIKRKGSGNEWVSRMESAVYRHSSAFPFVQLLLHEGEGFRFCKWVTKNAMKLRFDKSFGFAFREPQR